jgi:hypothetical protein
MKALIIDAIADNIRKQAHLDDWIRVANICNIGLLDGFGFLDLCEFWRTALLKSINDYIKQQNDSQKEVMRSIESKMDKDISHNSVFSSIPSTKHMLGN